MTTMSINKPAINLKKPKAVLFDWDNTLVDTWPIIHNAINETFRQYNMREWDIEETKDRVRKSMRDSFPEIFGDNWQEAGKTYQKTYQETHLRKLAPLPGAAQLLELLATLPDIYVAVVSNKTGGNLRKEAAHLGWEIYFDTLVGSGDAEFDKPHCAPVKLAVKGTDLDLNDEVWFVGDSEIDLECAVLTSCQPILYGEREFKGADEVEILYGLTPVKVRNHSELIDLVKNIF